MNYIKFLVSLAALCVLTIPAFSMPDAPDRFSAGQDAKQMWQGQDGKQMPPVPDSTQKTFGCEKSLMGQDGKQNTCSCQKSMMGQDGMQKSFGPEKSMMGHDGMKMGDKKVKSMMGGKEKNGNSCVKVVVVNIKV